MAANLSQVNGRVEMASSLVMGRDAVWHRTGQRREGLYPSVQAVHEDSGVLHLVDTRPNFYYDDQGNLCQGKGVQIVREDTNTPLGYASDDYSTIQNKDLFGLIDRRIGEGLAGIMTAGVLGKGETSWVQAVVGEIGIDKIDRGITTLLASNNHTASGSASIGFCTTWVVCANTEAMAQREWARSGNVQKIIHLGDTAGKLNLVDAALDVSTQSFKEWERAAQELARINLSDSDTAFKTVVAALMPDNRTVKDWLDKPQQKHPFCKRYVAEVLREFKDGMGQDLPSRKGTAWGLFNGVTSWVDFKRTPKSSADDRIKSMWFGAGKSIKDKAMNAINDHIRDAKPFSEATEKVAALIS